MYSYPIGHAFTELEAGISNPVVGERRECGKGSTVRHQYDAEDTAEKYEHDPQQLTPSVSSLVPRGWLRLSCFLIPCFYFWSLVAVAFLADTLCVHLEVPVS